MGLLKSERPGRKDIIEVLEIVGLADRADDKVRTFSFGMRQRLGLAQALLPRPELLIFDEPTDGLDPVAVLELRSIFKRLQTEHAITIVLASHLLIEVEKLVDSILVLAEGRVLFYGLPDELLRGEHRVMIRSEGNLEAALKAFRMHGFEPEMDGDGQFVLPANRIHLSKAADLLKKEGLRLSEFHHVRPTLEDALLRQLRASRNQLV